ncbi:hypothetical protein [Halorubrum ezzemoulense]|nr:hypothetical protein [Halorubrum ezzemoulense]
MSSDRDTGATSPLDEEPKLLYCDRCVGDTLHSWSGSDWMCDACGARWSK